ncbi:MAG: flagellar biosynthesis protein FlhB [Vampirovibrionales bacterium]|nr:flagellar biosynthesis protein FlhB [Vampirovibrionales bacterium]
MSGADKTEQPTQKRLDDARKKGQVARSQDFNGAMSLVGAAAMLGWWGPAMWNQTAGITRECLTHLLIEWAKPTTNAQGLVPLLSQLLEQVFHLLGPFFLGVALLGVGANLLQNKLHFSSEALTPSLDKINPLNGFKRIFAMRSVVELVKAVLKMIIIGVVATSVISGHVELLSVGMLPFQSALSTVLKVVGEVMTSACVTFFVLGFADWMYQKYELNKQLRMTKQEIKDEVKNAEGDAKMKGRIRELGIQMSRNKQLKNVKTADVIITNPTHYAVALQYDPDICPAPRVVAKGVDHFALKLREIGGAAGVPIQENKPLARALYALVEVEAMIPPELFVAVAEVLAVVFKKRKGRKGGTASR